MWPDDESGDPPPTTPCLMERDGEEPDAEEIVFDLNGCTGLMLGRLMGRGPEDGEDDRDDSEGLG